MGKEILAVIWCGAFSVLLKIQFLNIREKFAAKKEHKQWIIDCRHCLSRVARGFRCECESLAEAAFAQYSDRLAGKTPYRGPSYYASNSFIHKYKDSIDKLKDEYIAKVEDKVRERMIGYTITSVPDFLVVEYTEQITEIAKTFRNFGDLMWEQLYNAEDS